jgi:hypothetical protein
MNVPFLHLGPVVESPWVDLSDSLDVRLIASGRLSPTAIDIRHDRAELARVLGPAMEPRADGAFRVYPDSDAR